MRFITVRGLLTDHISPYHRRLTETFRRYLSGELPPRVRLLVEYLVEYEEKRVDAIRSFIQELSGDETIERWTPYPDTPLVLDESSFDRETFADFDRLAGLLLVCRSRLVEFLDACASAATDPLVRRIFLSLRLQEERGMKRFARQIQGLSDL
ncbi:MAG: hypothetical protein Fur0034_12530 [Desulfuromonadia bacterium]